MSDPIQPGAEEIKREVGEIKGLLAQLQQRLTALESRLPTQFTASTPTQPSQSSPSAAPKTAHEPTDAPKLSPIPAAPSEPKKSGENWETRIGRYWLNRLGIGSLVLGVAFFLLYTVQYLGPAAKILLGIGTAGSLLGAGVWIERRPHLAWYGRGLIGGGWALLYFTVYAMHHIPAVRILSSASIDLFLLALVAACAVWHSLRYKSETITAMALALGFVTTSLSDITFFTLGSTALLVGSLAWLVARMQWSRLLLYGVAASYGSHYFWVGPQIGRSLMTTTFFQNVGEAAYWLNAGFLLLFWVAYNAALYSLNERDRESRDRLVTTTLVNAGMFVVLMLKDMERFYPDLPGPFALAAGIFYLSAEWLFPGEKLPSVKRVHTLIGLALVGLAITLHLNGPWVRFWWLLQLAVVLWVGQRYDRWSYRMFAFWFMIVIVERFLTVDLWSSTTVTLLHTHVSWRLLVGSFAVVVLALCSVSYRMLKFRAQRKEIETLAFQAYFLPSAFIAWLLVMKEAPGDLQALLSFLLSAAVVWLGHRLSEPFLRVMGTVGIAGSSLGFLRPLRLPIWAPPIASLAAFGLSQMDHAKSEQQAKREPSFRSLYAAIGTAVLTIFVGARAGRSWVSVAWAIQALALLAFGFGIRDKAIRICGLGVFALLIGKILFVDLSGADTIYRILSFIVAGAMLLAASYGYATYAKRAPRNKSDTPQ